MPKIATVRGLSIFMFFKDHDPPHAHVAGADFRAKLALATGEIYSVKGRVTAKERRLIAEWHDVHRAALLKNWTSIHVSEAVDYIGDF